jgi:hypothetical protein
VPLSYKDPNGTTAAVALARIPAQISPDDPNYRGPILINPGMLTTDTIGWFDLYPSLHLTGGPGGSGVDTVVSMGVALQQVIGGEFDLVGFDPR